MPDKALVCIEKAKSVQDLARLIELHVKATQLIPGNTSDVALLASPNFSRETGGFGLSSHVGGSAGGDQLNFSQLSALCTRLAALMEAGAHPGLDRAQAMSLMRKLMAQVSTDLTEFPSAPLQLDDIQQFLASWAKLGYSPTAAVRSDLLFQLSPDGGNQLCSASSKTLASLAWSLQKLGWADQQLMRQLLDLAGRRAPGFDPDSLNLFATVLRSTGSTDKQASLQLSSMSRPLLPRLTPSDLALLLLTLVESNAHSSVLFASAAQHILPHVSTCMPRDLAWLATAYAQAGFLPKDLFLKIAAKAEQHAEYMDRKELAWLVRAFTMLRVYDAGLFDKMARSTEHYLQVVLPRELREQRMQYQAPRRSSLSGKSKRANGDIASLGLGLASTIGSGASDPINSPTQLYVDLADLAWGFARSGHYSQPLFDAIAAVASSHMLSFDAQKLGQLCWAFKRVQHHDPELMAAAAEHSLTLARELVGKQETLPTWSSWEQQAGYQTAGCSWLPFFPGPGSLGRPTRGVDLPPTSLADTWALVSVLACLSSFSEDCGLLLQMLHPLLANAIQPRQQHAAYGQAEELVLLLEPLVQQLQLQPRGWARHYAELVLQVMMAINKMTKSTADLPGNCQLLVVQSYIAMDDAGWGQELTTAVAGGHMIKEALGAWKLQVKQQASKERAAWQVRLLELLGPMGATHMQGSARTPDGLFGCLLLVTVRGRRLAIDFCSSDMYASNVPSPEGMSSGQRGGGSARGLGGEGTGRSRGTGSPLPPGSPILYPGERPRTARCIDPDCIGSGPGGARASTNSLPSPSAAAAAWDSSLQPQLQPLFSQSFRARGLRHRGWLPVLLPVREWLQVVGSEAASRKYLEASISTALKRGAPKERG